MAVLNDDDLLGVEEPEFDGPLDQSGIAAVLAGVSISWLMQAFNMDRNTVKKKLAPLRPLRLGRGNSPIYHFAQAVSYLVKPQVDILQYVKSLQPKDLPPILQDALWSAKLKRQKWEENAGDLWRTEKVQQLLADTFKTMKTTIQLFAGNIASEVGLSAQQRKLLQDNLDGLQRDLHHALIEQARSSATLSQLAEAEDEDPTDLLAGDE